jgi:hypothetical protein
MTDESRLPRIERILDLTARKVSGGSLHPLEIIQRVSEAVESRARDGIVPNEVTIAFNDADFERYQPGLAALRQEIDGALDDIERRRGLRRIGEREVWFERSTATAEGRPGISARFTDTKHRSAGVGSAPPGSTRRVARLDGTSLVVDGIDRVTLTHAPFTIGRGPGNDLVLTSLSVSRNHAEIVREGEALVLRDLDSRNGISVDGNRYSSVRLSDGIVVSVGDVSVRIEMRS